VQLIDRRIGFIFAVFLALLAIGATKAAWLGVVKANVLQRAAVGQQEADVTIPARRGLKRSRAARVSKPAACGASHASGE